MYNDEVGLISITISNDSLGNQIETKNTDVILCKKKSVSQAEFYNAAINGIKPSLSLVVHAYEYDDQRKIVFLGEEFNVIRTYEESFEEIELICEKAVSND